MNLILASNNKHKAKEIKEILGGGYINILTLEEAGIISDPEENGETFMDNAIIKVKDINLGEFDGVIGDDSGLIIDELPDLLGVKTARFLGKDTEQSIKNKEVLRLMNGKKNREARFICAIAFKGKDGKIKTIEGVMEGEIGESIEGENGFGYDPIFISKELGCCVSLVSDKEKNRVSHRGKAIKKLKEIL